MIGGVHGGNDEHAQLLKRTHVLALDEFVEKTRGDGPLVGVQPVENRLLRFEVVVEPPLDSPRSSRMSWMDVFS